MSQLPCVRLASQIFLIFTGEYGEQDSNNWIIRSQFVFWSGDANFIVCNRVSLNVTTNWFFAHFFVPFFGICINLEGLIDNSGQFSFYSFNAMQGDTISWRI